MIVEPRSLQPCIIEAEAERLDQMKARSGIRAEPDDIARVWGNLWLKKYNVQHLGARCINRVQLPDLLVVLENGSV